MSRVDLADLETTGRADLIAEWTQLFGMPPSSRTGQVLMRRLIAYERQARAQGGLTPALRRQLEALGTGKAARTLTPGAQLVRDWNGEQHVVDVVESGFVWRETTYGSLSALAEAITGARWSGPRFFGLRS